MATLILKNLTASPITINQLSVIDATLPASGTRNLTDYNLISDIQKDTQLYSLISGGSAVLNLDGVDQTQTASLNLLVPLISTTNAMYRTTQVEVDFGFATALEGDIATVTVAATWVTAATTLICNVAAVTTTDHDPEDATVEGIVASASNIIVGVSFDVIAQAPQGSWGRYKINVMGLS